MRIQIVNPNTTVSMTEKIAAAAKAVAVPGTKIVAATSKSGPASIEGHFDGAMAVPGLLAEIARGEREGVDAHVIACFDDTGLDAARSLARAPVIGIGEAAFHLGTIVSERFTVVTTLSCSVPILQSNLFRYGFDRRCARVRAAEVPVLSLEEEGSPARQRIADEIAAALAEDHCDAIVLGCAGMADLCAFYAEKFGVPVIEGVSAAVKLAEGTVALGLRTSKSGGWAPPIAKRYDGLAARFLKE